MQAAKAQASLCICADSPEPSMLADAISAELSCNVIYMYVMYTGLDKHKLSALNCKYFLTHTF